MAQYIDSSFNMIADVLIGQEAYQIPIPNNPVHPAWSGNVGDSEQAFLEAERYIRDWLSNIQGNLQELDGADIVDQRRMLGKRYGTEIR